MSDENKIFRTHAVNLADWVYANHNQRHDTLIRLLSTPTTYVSEYQLVYRGHTVCKDFEGRWIVIDYEPELYKLECFDFGVESCLDFIDEQLVEGS